MLHRAALGQRAQPASTKPPLVAHDSRQGTASHKGYHTTGDAGDLDAAGWAYPCADTSCADVRADGRADQRVGVQGAGLPRETFAVSHAPCDVRHATGSMRRAACDVRHATDTFADRRQTARPIAINGIRCCCSTEYCRCQAYEHAHAIAPQASSPFYGICRVKLDRCDWEGYDDRRALHCTARAGSQQLSMQA